MFTLDRRANVLNVSRQSVLPTKFVTKITEDVPRSTSLVRLLFLFSLDNFLTILIYFADQFSAESEVQAFFTAMGSGSPADVADEAAGGDDDTFEKTEEVKLYFTTFYHFKVN